MTLLQAVAISDILERYPRMEICKPTKGSGLPDDHVMVMLFLEYGPSAKFYNGSIGPDGDVHT